MVADHFAHDEGEEFLGKIRVKVGFRSLAAELASDDEAEPDPDPIGEPA